jgi:hypothetical protein
MADYAITPEHLQKSTNEFKAIVAARVERRVTAIWSGTADRGSTGNSGKTAARYRQVFGTGHRPVARQYVTTLAYKQRRGRAAQLLLALRTNSLALNTRKGSVTARRRRAPGSERGERQQGTRNSASAAVLRPRLSSSATSALCCCSSNQDCCCCCSCCPPLSGDGDGCGGTAGTRGGDDATIVEDDGCRD